jgi:hypothetical protein
MMNEMNNIMFRIPGQDGFIEIHLDEIFGFPEKTSHFGGYDVKGTVHIKSNGYSIKDNLWFSTGKLYNFYHELSICYDKLEGSAKFISSEANLDFSMFFDKSGFVKINGIYVANYAINNRLEFEIKSDQSYLKESISQLKKIVIKYGDNKGISNKSNT